MKIPTTLDEFKGKLKSEIPFEEVEIRSWCFDGIFIFCEYKGNYVGGVYVEKEDALKAAKKYNGEIRDAATTLFSGYHLAFNSFDDAAKFSFDLIQVNNGEIIEGGFEEFNELGKKLIQWI